MGTEEVESYFDNTSFKYDEMLGAPYCRVYDVITLKYLEPCVPTNGDALVLDAGGGTGRWAVQMARKGYNVILMDISEGMLRVAVKRTEKDRLQHKIAIMNGDIAKTGFPDETFGMILRKQSLFLYKKHQRSLKNLIRSSKEVVG
jgi:ubiquinone/menaquinone biosynthesis C-methylase UbiE